MPGKRFGRTALAGAAAMVLAAGSASAGPDASALRDELELGNLEFALDTRTNAAVFGAEGGRHLGGSWKDFFSLAGKLEADTPFTLKFDAKVVDQRRLAGEDLDAARFGRFDAWERRTVGDSNLKFGLFDNRLKLTSRLGWSRTVAAPADLRTFLTADPAFPGDFDDTGGTLDLAVFQRLDATVWRSDYFKLAAFSAWGRVGQDFDTLRESDQSQKDFFDRPNRSVVRGGAKLRAGPVGLLVSRSDFTHDIHLDSGERRGSTIDKGEMEFSLDEVAPLLGHTPRKGVFRWLPSSLTLSGAMGRLEPYADAKVADGVTDTSIGVWWYRGLWSAGASVWRSYWDSRQPDAEDADWLSSGADLSVSIYGDLWDVSGTVGVGRTLNQEESTRSAQLDLQGSLTVGLRPEWLPDLSGTLSLNRASTDYIAYAAAAFDDYWQVAAAADFSKFLPQGGGAQPVLKVVYGFSRWSADDGFDDSSRNADHALLLRLGLAF